MCELSTGEKKLPSAADSPVRPVLSVSSAFIAGDVHLDSRVPEREAAFCRFLRMVREKKPDALILLGDIFEFWFGYHTLMFSRYIRVIAQLAAVREAGVRIVYLTGNHDFNPGPVFSEFLEADIHYSPVAVQMGSRRVYLAHGDEINTDDKGYLFLRKILYSPLAQFLFKAVPAGFAWRLGRFTSDGSRKYSGRRPELDEDIFGAFLRAREAEGFHVVIHGHTHRPDIREISVSGRELLYINSGHWFGPAYYVVFWDDAFSLCSESL